CPDNSVKHRWYKAERRLRNQTDRAYDAVMGFSVSELEAGVVGSGQDAPPDVDVYAALDAARAVDTLRTTLASEIVPERKPR
ncbi:MAG: hypothetical protein Q7S99_16335, partial [Parvibaculum sp.]|nr:hypothetical protein [Parvibaculum sp.]